MDPVGAVRRWWWQRGHERFYTSEVGQRDPYALNAGTPERFQALVAELGNILSPGPDDVVLDLGGGNGYLSAALFGGCRQVVVLDLCRPSVAAASAFVVADLAAPPFRGEAFTMLFSYSTFPHLGSRAAARRALRAWDSLVARGGTVFIGDIPDRARLHRILGRGVGRLARPGGLKYYAAVSLISYFSRAWLGAELRALGYDVAVLDQSPQRRFHRERFDLLARKPR